MFSIEQSMSLVISNDWRKRKEELKKELTVTERKFAQIEQTHKNAHNRFN